MFHVRRNSARLEEALTIFITIGANVSALSLLLYEPYANESSQICPFLAGRPQFESVHHQNRRLSSHSYSHESVIFFVFLGLILFKLRRVCVFEFNCTRLRAAVDNGALRLSPFYYDRGQQVAHSSRPHAESIGRSVAMWTFTGRIPLNGRRPLNGHPPSPLLYSWAQERVHTGLRGGVQPWNP